MKALLCLYMLMMVLFPSAYAATGNKNQVIVTIQAESVSKTGGAGIVYLRQGGAWTGTSCNNTYAYFNALAKGDSPL